MTTAIHWFRRDLRRRDNTALARAAAEADRLLPIFVLAFLNRQRLSRKRRLAYAKVLHVQKARIRKSSHQRFLGLLPPNASIAINSALAGEDDVGQVFAAQQGKEIGAASGFGSFAFSSFVFCFPSGFGASGSRSVPVRAASGNGLMMMASRSSMA